METWKKILNSIGIGHIQDPEYLNIEDEDFRNRAKKYYAFERDEL